MGRRCERHPADAEAADALPPDVAPPDALPVEHDAAAPDVQPVAVNRVGLVAHWRFDDGSGTRVADSSSNGNHGTLKNIDGNRAWTNGRIGGALVLDGASWVSTSRSSSYDGIVSRMTAAGWVWKGVNQPRYRMLLHRQNGNGVGDRAYLGFVDDRPYFQFEAAKTTGPSALPVGVWVHVAGTYDGLTARLYVNGIEVASASEQRTLSLDPNGFTIGAERNTANPDFAEGHVNGRVDDLVLFNRALSPAEIKALADGLSP